MAETFEKLALFLDKIKSATFWDRVLPSRWRSIRTLSYEAYSEYKELAEFLAQKAERLEDVRTTAATLRQENEQLKLNSAKSEKELEHMREKLDGEATIVTNLRQAVSAGEETVRQLDKNVSVRQNEIARLQGKIDELSKDASDLKGDVAMLKGSEVNMLKQYENKMATLDAVQKRIEKDREQEKDEWHRAEIQRITFLKDNWTRHQETVKETIKNICQKHIIEYVENVPFKGSPDNTIKICDEYIIFDAKGPGTEDLAIFYKYLRTQAEGLKKYAKEENVKKEIFLIVPSNTVDAIEQFSFNMGDYNVYVVTVDVLEPLILALRKIEDYEFAKELTPEERENICRIIGKFAHTAKRRIQIDHFFARQFLDILTKCESDVPSDLLQKAVEFEKAEKLNPPQEKRAKQLPSKELVTDTGKIRREAEAKDVVFPESVQEGIKAFPLYQGDEPERRNQESK